MVWFGFTAPQHFIGYTVRVYIFAQRYFRGKGPFWGDSNIRVNYEFAHMADFLIRGRLRDVNDEFADFFAEQQTTLQSNIDRCKN